MNQNISFCDKNHFKVIKGIAIIIIMMGHIGNFTGKTWFTPLGGIGAAIFLFCSGYGLTLSAQNGLAHYWKKKFFNIYLPFFVLELAVFIALKRSVIDFLLDITLIRHSHPYGWYMQYIFVCYSVFYLVHLLVKSNSLRFFIVLVLGIASFFVSPNLQAEQALSFALGIGVAISLSNSGGCMFRRKSSI